MAYITYSLFMRMYIQNHSCFTINTVHIYLVFDCQYYLLPRPVVRQSAALQELSCWVNIPTIQSLIQVPQTLSLCLSSTNNGSSSMVVRLGGVKMLLRQMGKLGHAWVHGGGVLYYMDVGVEGKRIGELEPDHWGVLVWCWWGCNQQATPPPCIHAWPSSDNVYQLQYINR